jgi:cytochrome c-type biogenesis protein CcmH
MHILLALLLTCATFLAQAQSAGTALPAAADPALEARMLAITAELRCLVCQNQTIADSHSGLAEDLRREVRDQLRNGASNDDVRRYMVERYGDFVLYRPPVKSTTWLLWAGPALLLLAALVGLRWTLRRRARLDPALFEPDPEPEPEPVRDAAPGAPR